MFSILIYNVDDHLRNHGLLWEGPAGWGLAPAYDLNPTPTVIPPRVLSLAVDDQDPTASLEAAFLVAEYFGNAGRIQRIGSLPDEPSRTSWNLRWCCGMVLGNRIPDRNGGSLWHLVIHLVVSIPLLFQLTRTSVR